MIYRGDPYHPAFVPEWKMDWEQAWDAAHLLHAAPEARIRYFGKLYEKGVSRFQREEIWQAIASLADELLAHETWIRIRFAMQLHHGSIFLSSLSRRNGTLWTSKDIPISDPSID